MRNGTVNITGLSLRNNDEIEGIHWVFIQESLNYQQ